MSSLSSFLFASFIGTNTQELSNLRNLSSPPQPSNNATEAGSSSSPNTQPDTETMGGKSEITADVKEGNLPSGPDRNDDMIGLPPPPYSETATHNTMASSQASPSYVASTGSNAPILIPSEPLLQSTTPPKVQQSDAISASRSVNLSGPLYISGKVHSSSSVTLSNSIKIDGKVNSSSNITLINGIDVGDKVSASGSVKIDGGEMGSRVASKVSASGSVEILGGDRGVEIGDRVGASGSVTIVGGRGGVRVVGGVSASGKIEVRGSVHVGEDLNASGKVRIFCNDEDQGKLRVAGFVGGSSVFIEGNLDVEGDFNVKGSLTLKGRLTVQGDLTVNGNFSLEPGSEFAVKGKRTIHGSLKQL